MDNELIFSGFIDKDKKEHASITIKNTSDRVIFFNDYSPEASYDSFSLKDSHEMLMVEWSLDNSSPEEFLRRLISNLKNQNVFWNVKKEGIQEIGVKDKDILDKVGNNGLFSVLAVNNEEMTVFQKDLSSGKSKIKTFFSNQKHSYIDLINYFLKEQEDEGFHVSITSKKIVKIKIKSISGSKIFQIKPSYVTIQTLFGAPTETIPGSFFVIEIPKKFYNFLTPFSHCIIYNHQQDPSFEVNKLQIHFLEFLEIEDFFLCSINVFFRDDTEDSLFF